MRLVSRTEEFQRERGVSLHCHCLLSPFFAISYYGCSITITITNTAATVLYHEPHHHTSFTARVMFSPLFPAFDDFD